MGFDPLTMMMVAAGTQAVGGIRQGNAAAGAAQYNAAAMQQEAEQQQRQAGLREDLVRSRARAQIGQQLAAGAQTGTELSGSNLDLLVESMSNAEEDALNTRYEGQLQARNLMSGAAITRAQGRQARTAGYLSAAGSALWGGSEYVRAGGKLPSFGRGGGPMSHDEFRRSERRY